MLEVSDKKAKENFSILRSLMKALGGIWANLSLKLTTLMRKNEKEALSFLFYKHNAYKRA